jgi:hypothetical protein
MTCLFHLVLRNRSNAAWQMNIVRWINIIAEVFNNVPQAMIQLRQTIPVHTHRRRRSAASSESLDIEAAIVSSVVNDAFISDLVLGAGMTRESDSQVYPLLPGTGLVMMAADLIALMDTEQKEDIVSAFAGVVDSMTLAIASLMHSSMVNVFVNVDGGMMENAVPSPSVEYEDEGGRDPLDPDTGVTTNVDAGNIYLPPMIRGYFYLALRKVVMSCIRSTWLVVQKCRTSANTEETALCPPWIGKSTGRVVAWLAGWNEWLDVVVQCALDEWVKSLDIDALADMTKFAMTQVQFEAIFGYYFNYQIIQII